MPQTMRSRPKFSHQQPRDAGANGGSSLASTPSSLHGASTRDNIMDVVDTASATNGSSSSPAVVPLATAPFYHASHGKPHRLFCELVMPLARNPSLLPEKTAFVFTEEDILASALARIDKKCPHLYRDKDMFMGAVEAIVYGNSGSTACA